MRRKFCKYLFDVNIEYESCSLAVSFIVSHNVGWTDVTNSQVAGYRPPQSRSFIQGDWQKNVTPTNKPFGQKT